MAFQLFFLHLMFICPPRLQKTLFFERKDLLFHEYPLPNCELGKPNYRSKEKPTPRRRCDKI